MSIDLNSLFGQAKDAASQGMTDMLNTMGNSALGYLETQGANALQGMAKQNAAQAQAATSEILNRPGGGPDSFGNYLSSVMQSPVLKQYGPTMMIAVAAIVILTLAMR